MQIKPLSIFLWAPPLRAAPSYFLDLPVSVGGSGGPAPPPSCPSRVPPTLSGLASSLSQRPADVGAGFRSRAGRRRPCSGLLGLGVGSESGKWHRKLKGDGDCQFEAQAARPRRGGGGY